MVEKELYNYNAHIDRVVDGDTVDATVDVGFGIYVKQRFRIRNFDAPESWRPQNYEERVHGESAKKRATELLLDKIVLISTQKHVGIYGRYGATITLEDGRIFKDIMIEEGLAKKESYDENHPS